MTLSAAAGYLVPVVWGCLGAQFYHYVGYPALLWVLSRLRPKPPRKARVTPSVSLIIAAYNEEVVIGAKIENSLALDYRPLEIIIASEGSTDRTPEIVESFASRGVVAVHGPVRRGKALALNEAVQRATGDVLVFTDANSLFRADALRRLVMAFADPTVGCVGGSKTVRGAGPDSSAAQGEGLYWRYEDLVKRLETLVESTAGVSGEMLAVRRNQFVPFSSGTINDDASLGLAAMRRGERVVYEPDAQCWEVGSTTLADDLARRARMTAGRWQVITAKSALPWNRPLSLGIYLSHKVLRLLLPLFMIVGLAASLAVCMLPGHGVLMLALLALQLGAVAAGLLGAAADCFGLGLRPARLVWYLMLGHWSSLIGLTRFMTGGQSPLWQMASRRVLHEPGAARSADQLGPS